MTKENSEATKQRLVEATATNAELLKEKEELYKAKGPVAQLTTESLKNFDGGAGDKINELEQKVTAL